MNEHAAVELIASTLADIVGADVGELTMDMNLVELELLDSLDISTFLAAIETKIGRALVAENEVDFDLFEMGNLVAKIANLPM